MVDEAIRAQRERTVLAHIEAENRQDVAATLATFRDAHYDVVALERPTDGADAVATYLSGLFTGFPDFRAEVTSMHHADDLVLVDVIITGTHKGPFNGLRPTGRSVQFRAGCLFHFDGADLVKETVYFDTATILRQLGVLPAMGSRAERAMIGLAGLGLSLRLPRSRRMSNVASGHQ